MVYLYSYTRVRTDEVIDGIIINSDIHVRHDLQPVRRLAWRGIEVGPVGVVVVEGKIELHLESTQLGVSAKHAGWIRSAWAKCEWVGVIIPSRGCLGVRVSSYVIQCTKFAWTYLRWVRRRHLAVTLGVRRARYTRVPSDSSHGEIIALHGSKQAAIAVN